MAFKYECNLFETYPAGEAARLAREAANDFCLHVRNLRVAQAMQAFLLCYQNGLGYTELCGMRDEFAEIVTPKVSSMTIKQVADTFKFCRGMNDVSRIETLIDSPDEYGKISNPEVVETIKASLEYWENRRLEEQQERK